MRIPPIIAGRTAICGNSPRLMKRETCAQGRWSMTYRKLDWILRLPEPEKTKQLREWLEQDHEGDGRVLLKTASGKPMVVRYRGQVLDFNAQGRRVPRRIAIDLLILFGERGIYRGRDQATGFTREAWARLSDEEKRLYDEKQIRFLDDYLTHVPDGEGPEEAPPEVVLERPILVR